MSEIELFILAVGLSMDAFAVSMCKGLALKRVTFREMATAGLYFGGFQAAMPLVGYLLGTGFSEFITAVDHWIAFGLLAVIGGNMIYEEIKGGEESVDPSMGFKTMTVLAVATSIDALAVGVTLAFLKVEIISSVVFIGCVTFVLSAFGVWLGRRLGGSKNLRANLWGGIVLIAIGAKILLEHLGII